jgi:hypothetical protein
MDDDFNEFRTVMAEMAGLLALLTKLTASLAAPRPELAQDVQLAGANSPKSKT